MLHDLAASPAASSHAFSVAAPDAIRAGANRPAYYVSSGGLEPIHVIRNWSLGFELGNAVKYILRAGRKGPAAADLEKALTYLQFVSDQLGSARTGHDRLGPLLEWRTDKVKTLSPMLVTLAFGLDEHRATAIGCIYDLSDGPTFSVHWITTAIAAVERALDASVPPAAASALTEPPALLSAA